MILGIVQARLSSTRFPGKVLKPILGAPMIVRQLERVRRAKTPDRWMLVTSLDPSDDPLADLCRKNGYGFFRGSLTDVLDRFYQAGRDARADHIVRLTGDCPLADPGVIDDVVRFYQQGGYQYASNTLEPTFPDGLDVETFSFIALEKAWREARLASEREHVTPYFYKNPALFKLGNFRNDTDFSHFRWTVDEPADLELVTAIYQALLPLSPAFGMRDVLAYLEAHPELSELNKKFKRNQGYQASLTRDHAGDGQGRV